MDSNNNFNQVGLKKQLSLFCDYVAEVTQLPVLKARRTFVPQMSTAFLTVGYSGIEPMERELSYYDKSGAENNFNKTIRGLFRVTLNIQVFGEDALDVLRRLKLSFNSDTFFYWCEQNHWGSSGVGEIQDISGVLLDSNYEERAQMEASFYIDCAEKFSEKYFNQMEVEIER